MNFELLGRQVSSGEDEERAFTESCREALDAYRAAVLKGDPPRALVARARAAYLHMGGDPDRPGGSLGDYDHVRYGPFLGVSDEGSAAGEIRMAALESPKVQALSPSAKRTPMVVGVAVDAERLGGIGEIAVGPEEYADIWLACVDRVLVTTNVGTRVNVRVYRREPRILVTSADPQAVAKARAQIEAAFKPFVLTPDGKPRPLTVFVEFPRLGRKMKPAAKRATLRKLSSFVASGEAAGKSKAPKGHALGLAASVRSGLGGRDDAMAAIDLAATSGLGVVILDGVKRKAADEAISLAGLLDYFAPGIVGALLRRAREKGVILRSANLPDTDTIARSTWVGLTTARNMGAHLGKYGCFPLTRPEIDHVVEQVQQWLPHWSAAPVFFVDQGLLREGAVDVRNDLPRGIEAWLDTVATHGVRVVLVDTIDKSTGRRLLKRSSKDKTGHLGLKQIERIEAHARRLGIRVLWAGGLGLREVFEMGKRGVFGIYVTTAAATTVPVGASYARDPALSAVKEPSREAVLRTKILLEAGFLASKLDGSLGARIDRSAEELLAGVVAGDARSVAERTAALAGACRAGWRFYWREPAPGTKRTAEGASERSRTTLPTAINCT
jgi:hypothetical protein